MKTLAAILEKQGEPLTIKELQIPPLERGQVLVQIAYSGLCHSQLNEMSGAKGPDPYLPHTLGHEGSGIVCDVGPDVTKVSVGDQVVLSWMKGAGIEAKGAKYQDGDRQINSGAISTFLRHAIISENRMIPIPASMPLKEAALLGCAVPTGAGAVFYEMKLERGASLAIFGLGGVGLSALIAAHYSGAHPIFAVDIHEEKLQMAGRLGATHLINAAHANPVQEILQATKGEGVDFSMEAAGKRQAMQGAYESVKPSNGVCVLAGNLHKGEKMEIDPFDLIRGKRILGTAGGKSKIDQDVQQYVRLFSESRFPISHLITDEVELFQINELCHKMRLGMIGRGLIRFV